MHIAANLSADWRFKPASQPVTDGILLAGTKI
jgi:hypothetical protein